MDRDEVDLASPWGNDMNVDGEITLADVGLWLKHVFFLPGDFLLSTLLAFLPGLGADFGLSEADLGGPVSAVLSCIAWLFCLICVVLVVRRILRACVDLADYVVAMVRAGHRRATIAKNSMASRLSRPWFGRASAASEGPMDVELDEVDMAVLRVEARLQPGYVLTAVEIADRLRVQPSRAQRALRKLDGLGLVDYTFSSMDGYDGYRLTRAGDMYLAACGSSSPSPA